MEKDDKGSFFVVYCGACGAVLIVIAIIIILVGIGSCWVIGPQRDGPADAAFGSFFHHVGIAFKVLGVGAIFALLAWPFVSYAVRRADLQKKKRDNLERQEREQLEATRAAEKATEERERPLRERKQRELERAGRDRSYDRVINCPWCKGTGLAEYWICERKGHPMGDEETRRIVTSDWEREAANGADVTQIVKDDDGDWELRIHNYLFRNDCVACKGTGTAYARFEMNSEECQRCKATGVITSETSIKQEVGVKRVSSQASCPQCEGLGITYVTQIYTKLLADEDDLAELFIPGLNNIEEVHEVYSHIDKLGERWKSVARFVAGNEGGASGA